MLLHQLVEVLLVLLHPRLQLVLLSLQSAQLLLQLKDRKTHRLQKRTGCITSGLKLRSQAEKPCSVLLNQQTTQLHAKETNTAEQLPPNSFDSCSNAGRVKIHHLFYEQDKHHTAPPESKLRPSVGGPCQIAAVNFPGNAEKCECSTAGTNSEVPLLKWQPPAPSATPQATSATPQALSQSSM